MNSHERFLRDAAIVMHRAGDVAWGNTCEAAADEIERLTKSEPTEAQIEARDALLDFISENGTASEGVQHYLDRYVRAALAARETK